VANAPIRTLAALARRRGLLPRGGPEVEPGSDDLVVYLHGFTGHFYSRIDESLLALSEKHGFDLEMPQGTGFPRSWNAGGCCGPAVRKGLDDIGRIVALLEEARPRYRRVFLIGYSNGAMLATLIAATRADLVDGLGLVAGCIFGAPPIPVRPVPTIMVNASDDRIVPVAGGRALGFTLAALPATALARFWREANRSAAPVEVLRPATGGHRINPAKEIWAFLSGLAPAT
jgi:polyhydroxybutyrate depolymerase